MPDHPEKPRDRGLDLAEHATYSTVTQASATVLESLREVVGFRFWAVTRVTGQTYAIVGTGQAGFPARPGEQFPWAQTLCRQVVLGRAPRIAPDIASVTAYQQVALAEQWQIRAYLSTPLSLDGRSLYGTVCAVDPLPQPTAVTGLMALVDRQARLLSTVLAARLHTDQAQRRAERAEADALMDPLTGLVNRRGWNLLLDREEQRCQRYGTLASVLMLDLDGLKAINDSHGHAAGDALLRRAADVLRDAVRSADVVARLGGDEFAVLSVETDLAAARAEQARLVHLLAVAGIAASIGAATRDPHGGLAAAVQHADADMYRAKRQRQQHDP